MEPKLLSIRGKLATDQDFNIGDDVQVVVTITATEIQDNDDGNYTKIFKGKLFQIPDDKITKE